MITKEFVYNNVLPLVKEKGRHIDYLLIKSLFENVDDELIKALLQYQNKDLGFGHALEPDAQMPSSSILATDIAIEILNQIKDKTKIEPIIKDITIYLESQYDSIKDGFRLVTKEVNDFPHAVWWNYDKDDTNFPYGNPDAEVIGFLFKHRKYITNIDINKQINNIIKHILSDDFLEADDHNAFSALRFHSCVDKDVKNLIHERLHVVIDHLIIRDKDKWDEYGVEPYKIYLMDQHYTEDHTPLLKKNLDLVKASIESLNVFPNWKWHQYDDVFEKKVKFEWMGYIYFEKIKALRLNRLI